MKKTMKRILCTVLVAVMVFSCVSVGVSPSVKAIDNTYSVSIVYDYTGNISKGYLKVWYYPINSDGTITLTKTEHNISLDNLLNFSLSEMMPGIEGDQVTAPFTNVERRIDNIPGWPCEINIYLYDDCSVSLASGGQIVLKSININEINILANDFIMEIEKRELPPTIFIDPDADSSVYDAYLDQTFRYDSNDGLTTNWTLPSVPFKYFPKEYNFNKDKFPFENPTHSISFKRFTDFFGPLWASIIYALHSKTGEKGTCFGMATATGALLKNYTSLSDITYKDEYGNKLNPSCINDIWNGTLGHQNFYIDSLNMTVSDYIDYGFLYQWGPWESWIESSGDPWDSIITLYNDVYDFVYNGGEPVVVNIGSGFSGHTVLAVGLKENSKYGKYNCTEIIIDDSNHLEERSIYLLKNDEGEYFNWVFEFDNSEIWTGSTYSLATRKPASMFTYAVERMSNNLTYTLYEDYRLLLIEKEISLDTLENLLKAGTVWSPSLYYLNNESQVTETEQNEKLYWLDASYNEPLTFSTDETSASFTYSDYNTALSVDLPYETDCAISTTADDYINLETNNIEGKTIGINKTEFNENNEKYVLEINGLASSEITATQTETGLLVTGISDGTVTLTKDDEVIETQEIKDAVGEIEITYDKTGEDVELDYHSHSYSSSITTPATHTAEGVETFTCDCGDSYTKPVAKLEGHTHTVTNTVAPTCTKNGLTVYTCACGDSYSETVKAKGHSYGDDGICVNCDDYNKAYDKTANDSENCSHLCHKGGFMGFIWKIVQIFIRLFKTNPVCECGAAHY